MKDYEIIHSYTFNPGAKTVTFTGFGSINIEDIQLVRNITTSQILYASGVAFYGGTVSGNVLTLFIDPDETSNSTDDLQIFHTIEGAPIVIGGGGGGGGTAVYEETPTGTINGINNTFTLANTAITGTVRIYLNGQRLKNILDYTYTGSTITMTTIPFTGDVLIVDYNY